MQLRRRQETRLPVWLVEHLSLFSLSSGVCAAFVSRTGKTTDVTQIKGWREKFTPSEAPPTPAPPKPEGQTFLLYSLENLLSEYFLDDIIVLIVWSC